VAGGITWQTIAVALALIASITTFAVQLGSTQTHVIINGDRITLLETQHRDVDKIIARLLASQTEQDRRLNAIEAHDIETRVAESKIIERLGKIEGRELR
jgi:hypothetical protein